MKELIVTTREELTAIVRLAVRSELGETQPVKFCEDDCLTTEQAAQLLQQSKNTLRQWRSQGKGPAFERRGRTVRYPKSALTAWRDSNMVVTADSAEIRSNFPRSSNSRPHVRGASHA